MRKLSFLLICCVTLAPFSLGQAQTAFPYRDARLPVEQRVQDLLQRMTLEEKVAQLQCLWAAFRPQEFINAQGEFAPSDRVKAVLAHGIGQIGGPSLGMATDLENITGPYQKKGPREHAIFANQLQRYIIERNRLGIPAIFHEEALHGLAARGATSFPQAIALASTWDVELVREVFSAAAREARARGTHQVLTPVLDLAREPRWGRIEETYGEDPYLVARMGVAAVRGFQGDGPNIDRRHVIATLKHFAAHGQPEGGTNIAPANYSERVLREQFFYPFQAAVTEGGAMSVMASYNEIDGIPSHANRRLLGNVLRGEWGFRGFVVSDYFGINE
ncbi:glycoside hydrolase family 3 protein, partial [Pyrinomonas sp.]|uniref:glycoside hydrolase family 3 protein n=1 Tax=Pyrinomonas sp. TaxID=2080306 RepID=UPI0033298CB8